MTKAVFLLRVPRIAIIWLLVYIATICIAGTDVYFERTNQFSSAGAGVSRYLLPGSIAIGPFVELVYVAGVYATAMYAFGYGSSILFHAVNADDFEAQCCDLALLFIVVPIALHAFGNAYLQTVCAVGLVSTENCFAMVDLRSLMMGPIGVLFFGTILSAGFLVYSGLSSTVRSFLAKPVVLNAATVKRRYHSPQPQQPQQDQSAK